MLPERNTTSPVSRGRFPIPAENHLRLVRDEPFAVPESGDIISAVENALARDGELDSSYIFVSADGSDITLAGWVSTRVELRRSAEIAAGVKGVHAVRNEISRAL